MSSAGLGWRSALFSNEVQAKLYAQARPCYPAELYDRLMQFAALEPSHRRLALDVATGSGQVATELAQRFEQVVACDSSAAQLQHASPRPNVRYLQAPAEALPHEAVPRGSVDLVTCAQAFHWLDHGLFFREMRRVLAPHGTLAVWGYGLHQFLPLAGQSVEGVAAANAALHSLYEGTLGAYWDPARRLVEQHYAGLEPPPSEFRTVEWLNGMRMERHLSVQALLAYVRSWSSYQSYRREHPGAPDPVDAFAQQLREILELGQQQGEDEEAPSLRVQWPLFGWCAKHPVPL